MSSGEYDVQVEQAEHAVSNYQVARPARMLDDLARDDVRLVIAESIDYLLEREGTALGRVVSLDDLWREDSDFAKAMRQRLS
jgi:hypothetical protein